MDATTPIDRYDRFILDIDGVLVRGRSVIPGAVGAVERLRERGPVALLTNNSSRSRAELAEHLASIGIRVPPDALVPSSYIAASYLADMYGPSRVLVVGEAGLRREIEAAGHRIVSDPRRAAWVIVGLDRSLTYETLARALQAFLAGARLLATNRDATLPTDEGLLPGAGAIVGALEGLGAPPAVLTGKPSPIAFRVALSRLSPDRAPDRTLMIGDRPETDIAGARDAGLGTALVLSGVTSSLPLPPDGPSPDWVAADLAALVAGELHPPGGPANLRGRRIDDPPAERTEAPG